MPDFLITPFSNGPHVAPLEVFVRLLSALLFGVLIGGIYKVTRREPNTGLQFPTTLLLLCVLIAMVTQVIGDNVARAFSLVGALSIVRFRTVVRDTQDTAYVILAVIVGMAVGARSLWVASIGLGVVGLAEGLLLLRSRTGAPAEPDYILKVRTGPEFDLDTLVTAALEDLVQQRELISMGTGKQGEYLEGCYRVRLAAGRTPPGLIRAMQARQGVQSVQILRRGFDAD
ncbi:DUF4956 domain-containing protein [uncultured Paludibaculum sp.]|uniref:DUF4956 domain-containing protein n=1 Tax=uncultured Paludibaculum sp. TaxID=1765020 RepID=UPI002AAB71E7|nr:DUF4956 domain-containing protein [uncultured Paludibaculum sp.]